MSSAKIKPVFKPKFASPVANKSSGRKYTNEDKKKSQTGNVAKDAVDNDQLKNSENKRKSKRKERPRLQVPNQKQKDESLKAVSMTDSQYDDLFMKVLDGAFLDLDERFAGSQDALELEENIEKEDSLGDKQDKPDKKRKKNAGVGKKKKRSSTDTASCQNTSVEVENTPMENRIAQVNLTPAESFTKSLSDGSQNNTKRTNEITPAVSPEEAANKILAIKPEPRIKKSKQKIKPAKRKSLDYVDETGGKVTEHVQTPEFESEEINGEGTWVQCIACDKWRFLPECKDPSSLPTDWDCTLNPDKKFSNCSKPEEAWENSSEEFVYTQFTPGSIVWAKMAGYPAWPAMVDCEPDYNTFYETFSDGSVKQYHVVFLDDRVSRAWVSWRSIEAFRLNETPIKLPRGFRRNEYVKDLVSAKERAQEALEMSVRDRLEKFSFQRRFNGKSYWKHDKNSTEKREKRKLKDKERKVKPKYPREDETMVTALITSTPSKEKHPVKDCGTAEDPENRETSHVSASEDEVFLEKSDLEQSLLGNLAMHENQDQSREIPFVETDKQKQQLSDSRNFDKDAEDHESLKYEPAELKLKSATENEPLDLSGKKSSQYSPPENYLTPPTEKHTAVSTESLFEGISVPMEEGVLSDPSDMQWKDFEEMVMAE